MKKLMFATALVASAAAFADPAVLQAGEGASMGALNAISFEGYTAGDTFVNGAAEKDEDATPKTGYGFFYYEGDQDGSSVKAFGGEDAAATPTCRRPYYFASQELTNQKYLDLSTEGGILWRSINAISHQTVDGDDVYDLGTAQTIPADGLYLDTLIQFTPTEDGGTPDVTSDDKLAIWLNVDSSGATPVTNLMVRAKFCYFDGAGVARDPTNFVVNASVVAGNWYRLTIKAVQTVVNPGSGMVIPAFQIFIDGNVVAATTPQISTQLQAMLTQNVGVWGDGMADLAAANQVFPSLAEDPASVEDVTLQGVGFKGSGALDDIVWTENDPFPAPAAIDFTLSWPSGLTAVSYTLGTGGEPVAITGSSPLTITGVEDGALVAFLVQNADGAQKVLTATASSSVNAINAEGTTFGWAEYLGEADAVSGAYTIDDANDLDMLRKGVAAGLPTAGTNFAQTANIDMSTAGAFAGIGTYAANLNSGVAFCGTYDGQGFKISNVDFTQRNYGGVFNQVKGGTIKNLTVDTITCSTFDSSVNSGEWGCSIIGNVGLGSTVQNLTAMGSFGSAGTPCTHNVAGIAIRVCGGASNVVNGVIMLETLVKDCTNNATLYGSYTKCAGITALTQDQNGVPNDYALFDGCVNNANIAMVAGKGTEGRDGLSGILGYVADGTKMQNCVNNGTLTSVLGTAKIGGIVGWAQGRTLDDLGGNKNPAAAKMVGDPAGSTITGFTYATVDNGVATTVLPPLAAGNTYLLEGNVAASETPVFTLAAAGDTIAFDTALGYTFAGTVDGSAALVVTDSTVGSVTTFAAATAVAQITGGAKFATLQAAVDAALAGDTVTVLADCTITNSLSIAKNLTISNDFTIAANVNYAICVGATVAFGGTGKIERGSTITGSAFCVGANEETRGTITVGTAGALTFDGLTVCGGNGGNLIKLENGTVTMNGGILKDGKRGIKADADAGSYTSAIVINGGTITNCTDCAVMASAESATGTATVTINGGVIAGALLIDKKVGTYSITIPGTSKAKFNADQTAFCETGYETTLSDGWYVVSAIQSAGDYKVVIDGSDVVITPLPEDFAAIQPFLPPGVETNNVAAVNALLATPIEGTSIPVWQALFLGVEPTTNGLAQVAIKSISFNEAGKVVVEMADDVTLKTGRGVEIRLNLMGSSDLTNWSFLMIARDSKIISPVTPAAGETKKFYKVVVEFEKPGAD